MRVVTLLPEVLVAATAVGLLMSGRVRLRARQRRWLPVTALVAVAAALVLELILGAAVGTLFNGGFSQDRFALFAKAAVLLALGVAIAATDWELEPYRPVLPVALLAGLGGMVAASATNLLGLWAGLELASLAGVVAVAGAGRGAAGARLLVASGVGSGLLAVGFGLVYAISGVAGLDGIRQEMAAEPISLPLALAALLAVAGAAVRLVLAPLAQASLDTGLESSPLGAGVLGGLTAGTAAIVLVKFAAALAAAAPAWTPFVGVISAALIVTGGLRALSAASVRELVGWLVMGQAGWLVAGVAIHQRVGTAGALLLLAALALAATCTPILLADLEAGTIAGLGRGEPGRAAGLALALLSLAGVPPLAGFFGVFMVAAGLLGAGLGWLLGLGLLGSVLALIAATRAISPFYLEGPVEEQRRGGRGPADWSAGATVAGVLLLALGLFAYPVSTLAFQGAEALGLR